MKIIISESQLLEYMRVNDNEKIINNILDKISKDGQSVLSDEEKNILLQYSRGEKISRPETKKVIPDIAIDNDDDLYSIDNIKEIEHIPELTLLFMDIFPESENITINNEIWIIEQENSGKNLIVKNKSGIQFYIYPFSEEIDKLIIKNENFNFSFNMTKNLEGYNDMRRFVDAFKKQIFPQIIRKVKEQYI
jgi:hypothetical protein